jgi:hypothetical protein
LFELGLLTLSISNVVNPNYINSIFQGPCNYCVGMRSVYMNPMFCKNTWRSEYQIGEHFNHQSTTQNNLRHTAICLHLNLITLGLSVLLLLTVQIAS